MDLVCSECEVSSADDTDVFKCKACPSSESENTILCQFCVVSHVRKKHDVTQFDGQKIIICDVHKNICTSYCQKCKQFLCVQCTVKHVSDQHEVENVAKVAVECKKRIHSAIEDIDDEYKIAAKHLMAVEDCFETWRSSAKYTEKVAIFDFLSKCFENVCRSRQVRMESTKSLKWLNDLEIVIKESKNVVEIVGTKQKEMRAALGKSSIDLIQKTEDYVSLSRHQVGFVLNNAFDVKKSRDDLFNFNKKITRAEYQLERELGDAVVNFLKNINDSELTPGQFDITELSIGKIFRSNLHENKRVLCSSVDETIGIV